MCKDLRDLGVDSAVFQELIRHSDSMIDQLLFPRLRKHDPRHFEAALRFISFFCVRIRTCIFARILYILRCLFFFFRICAVFHRFFQLLFTFFLYRRIDSGIVFQIIADVWFCPRYKRDDQKE